MTWPIRRRYWRRYPPGYPYPPAPYGYPAYTYPPPYGYPPYMYPPAPAPPMSPEEELANLEDYKKELEEERAELEEELKNIEARIKELKAATAGRKTGQTP